MSERDLFLTMVGTGPLMTGDAIVLLCGEDAEDRAAMTLELFRPPQSAAPVIVLSGGLHAPPRHYGAKAMREKFVSWGVAPDRMILDTESQNTREQAVRIVAMAAQRQWTRLLVVASPYHVPRACLTFVQALLEQGQADKIRLVMVPTSQSRWYTSPDGMEPTRAELFPGEVEKIDAYGALGHVAPYAAGLAYLRHWELSK